MALHDTERQALRYQTRHVGSPPPLSSPPKKIPAARRLLTPSQQPLLKIQVPQRLPCQPCAVFSITQSFLTIASSLTSSETGLPGLSVVTQTNLPPQIPSTCFMQHAPNMLTWRFPSYIRRAQYFHFLLANKLVPHCLFV